MKWAARIANNKKIIDLLVYGFGQAVNLLSPLLVMPYLISVCGQDGLGRIGVGFSLALILSGIVDYGSYIKGVKEISINRENHDLVKSRITAIYFSKAIVLLVVLAVVSILIVAVPFFARDKVLLFLSLSMVIGQCLNPAWYFQATENFKWISALNVLSKTIYVGGIFFFVQGKTDYILANLFFGVGLILSALVGVFHIFRKYHIARNDFQLMPAKAILRDEFSFTASQFFLSVYQYFPIVMISYIAGDATAGLYRIIDQIVSVFKSALNIFFYFVYANVCFQLNNSLTAGLNVWKRYNGLFFLFLLTLAAVCCWQAETIFYYAKVDPSQIGMLSYYFRLGMFVPMLVAISQPLRQLLFAFDKNNIYIVITIAATIGNVLLMALLTNLYALGGALTSIILIEVIIIVLYLLILKKHLQSLRKR